MSTVKGKIETTEKKGTKIETENVKSNKLRNKKTANFF